MSERKTGGQITTSGLAAQPINTEEDSTMKVDDRVYTPRFCTVRIKRVFETTADAEEAGFTEPTYYEKDGYTVLGKSLDMYHMEFAAARV